MYILTAAQMRAADRRTIDDVGVPGRVLMESAGRAIVGVLEDRFPDLPTRSIGIVCGKGNNGGDGLVVLRTLAARGYDARAWVLSSFEDLGPDAIANLQAALKLGLSVEPLPSEEAWTGALPDVTGSDLIVDAMLGTGLAEAARGLYRRAIEDLEGTSATLVAVDVPSGLSSDTGSVPGEALHAALTIALGAPKVCHFVPPACEHCGDVEVVDIGIPSDLIGLPGPSLETIEADEVVRLWPRRAPSSHKGTFGHLLVVAGSVGKTGAALMTAESALRAGSGLVTVATPASAIPMMAPRLPEVMWEPLPETPEGAIASSAVDRVLALLEERSALAMGPGLGLADETVRLVRTVTSEARCPMVIDADGLNAVAGERDALPKNRPIALTPHPGEAGRLLGCSASAVQLDRLKAVRDLAKSTKAHALLKGFRTLVCDPKGRAHVNLTGNPGLATAGTGDVLTGIVGGLLAQGLDPADALVAGAFVHGLAGDRAAAELGQTGLLATDVIAALPGALRDLGVP